MIFVGRRRRRSSPVAEPRRSDATSTGNIRVLIVDDTPDIRDLIRITLGVEGGFDVVGEAADGQRAIAEAERLRPDLILLDLSMPVMDGLEALPEIGNRAPESQVLVLSGFDARQMGAEATRLGARAYMEKGRIAETLGARIRALFPDRHSMAQVPATPRLEVVKTPASIGEEIISALAHELMNPLTILQGFAMTLRRAAATMPPEAIQQSADAIARGAAHLSSLVQAFSDLRNLEVDTLDLILEERDLGELVAECVSDMAEISQSHPVIVRAQEGVVTRIDSMRVRQVVVNLLSNAAKFSPPGTPIEVDVSASQSQVEISVRDHGPGIPAHRRSELFGKFSRLGSNEKGTGLGLFISRGIARAHGGDLTLAASDGAGCRFVLRLPLSS